MAEAPLGARARHRVKDETASAAYREATQSEEQLRARGRGDDKRGRNKRDAERGRELENRGKRMRTGGRRVLDTVPEGEVAEAPLGARARHRVKDETASAAYREATQSEEQLRARGRGDDKRGRNKRDAERGRELENRGKRMRTGGRRVLDTVPEGAAWLGSQKGEGDQATAARDLRSANRRCTESTHSSWSCCMHRRPSGASSGSVKPTARAATVSWLDVATPHRANAKWRWRSADRGREAATAADMGNRFRSVEASGWAR